MALVAVAVLAMGACTRGRPRTLPHTGSGPPLSYVALGGADVGRRVRHDLIAGSAQRQDGDLVAHGPGRQEHGRLLAQQRSHAVAQPVHRRIRAALLVPDLGLHHGGAHGRGGPGCNYM